MKNLLIALSVSLGLTFAACGGRVVVDGFTSGSGGQGGAGGGTASVATTTGSFDTTNTTTGSFTSTTGTNGGGCASCAEALVDPSQVGRLCGTSLGLFDEFTKCACLGLCATECSKTLCAPPFDAGDKCQVCIRNKSNGCGFEFENCIDN